MFHMWIFLVGVGGNLLVCVRIFLNWIGRDSVDEDLFICMHLRMLDCLCHGGRQSFYMCNIFLYWIVHIGLGNNLFVCVCISPYIGPKLVVVKGLKTGDLVFIR